MQEQKGANGESSDSPQQRSIQERRWFQIGVAAILLGIIVIAFIYVGRRFGTDDLPQFVTGNLLNALIFAAIVGQVLIYRKQRDIMRDQWQAMRDQYMLTAQGLTHQVKAHTVELKSIELQAETMVGQLKAIREQVDLGKGQLVAMQHQEQAQFKALEQNERAAEDAKQINIYAQRAYVVAKIRGTSKDSTRLQFRLRIENSGNTPANNVWIHYSHGLRAEEPHKETSEQWIGTNENIVVFDKGLTESERLGLVAPHSSYHVIETPKSGPLTGDEAKEWRLGKLKYYCWGRISYDTIFEQGRHSDFCFYQSFEKPDGYPCKHGNDAI